MSAPGMHSPRLSEHHSGGFRVASVIVLAAVAVSFGLLHPTPSCASIHKISPKTRKVHKPEKGKPRKSAHRSHAGRKMARATHHTTKGQTAREHTAKRHAVTRDAVTRDAKRHGGKHRASQQLAHRRHDPGTIDVPQGDGAPLLMFAARFLGHPYRFGSDEGAFDCSGFVRHVFAEMGVDLPHSAREQFTMGDRVSRDDLEPGDLVFFRTSRHAVGHVGIYTGDDKFVHAASHGGQVQVDSLNKKYYARHYLGARRIEI